MIITPSEISNPNQALKTQGGFLISQIKNLSGRVWEKLLKASEVDIFNGPQGRILYVLWEHGPMPITHIGRLTSLAKTTLTSMLDRMEANGLIQRIPDTKNRRQIFIKVTPKALAYKEKYDQLSAQMNAIYYQHIPPAQITQFESILEQIIINLENEENKS